MRRFYFSVFAFCLLADITPSFSVEVVEFPVIRKAPEIVGIDTWINSSPLTVSSLKGKVVLVDFWDYSCINCIRTFPYLQDWYKKYHDKGFEIIGMHAPEFDFEKDPKNVQMAVDRFKIPYPVALDNEKKTWEAFNNAYWPCHYLIDQDGNIRYIHIGEGKYKETENAIRVLLQLAPLEAEAQESTSKNVPLTHEIYLGYNRAENYTPKNRLAYDGEALYNYPDSIDHDQVGLTGSWLVSPDQITALGTDCQLELNFLAGKVHIVASGSSSQPIRVELDGKTLPSSYSTPDTSNGQFLVKESRKYDVLDLKKDYGRHTVILHVPKGVSLYSFTFGE